MMNNSVEKPRPVKLTKNQTNKVLSFVGEVIAGRKEFVLFRLDHRGILVVDNPHPKPYEIKANHHFSEDDFGGKSV